MQLYDLYGMRTNFGVALAICTFILMGISAVLVLPVTGWAIFSSLIGCEMSCTPTFRWLLAILFICPVLLIVAIIAGFKATFGKAGGPNLALTFVPAIFVAGVLAVDFGYVSLVGFVA